MWNRAYLKRLREDLPAWAARGWVTEAGQSAILDDVASGTAGVRRASLAFVTLGVLLVGTGVILFFAANWSGMSKLAKLAVLFGGMWGVYLAGGWALARPDRIAGGFAQSLLLLGVILFGANINLIAQAYHISGHYPNAILLWALGGLAVAWLTRSQPATVLGLVVLALWSGMETFGFRQSFHWPFLVVWALFLPPILLWRWRFAAGTAMLALLLWHLVINDRFILFAGGLEDTPYLTAEVSLLAAVGFLLVGVMMEWHPRFRPLAIIVQRFAIVGALVDLQALTHFRGFRHIGGHVQVVVSTEWTAGILIALALLAPLGALVMREAQGRLAPGVVRSGMALFAVLGALIVTSLFIAPVGAPRTALGIGFNLFYYASLLWLIYAGYQRGDPFRVNTGFVFFVLGIGYLYFDTFWTLMDRSFSFVVGGLLLCGGGYLIEKQRRRLLARLNRPASDGEGA